MSLRQEIATWAEALEAYDAQDYTLATEKFTEIAESSRIFFNLGLIRATLGEHETAVTLFHQACELDSYLAVAYFQCGVSNFLLNRFVQAEDDFSKAYIHMRNNMTIDYDQIGLKFRLYSCEILFNRGLALTYQNRINEGMAYFDQARKEKQTPEHNVIDEAFAENGAGFTVFSIPVGVLYRPPESKLRNLKAKNYLGQAKLIAATDLSDAFTGFTGSTKAKLQGTSPLNNIGNKKEEPGLSRSKTIAANVDLEMKGRPMPRRPSADARIQSDREGWTAPPSKSRSQSVDETGKVPAPVNNVPFRVIETKTFAASPTNLEPRKYNSTSKRLPPINPPAAPLTPPDSNDQDDEQLRELYAEYEGPAESVLFETPAIQPQTSVRRPVGQESSRVAEWARKNAAPTNSMYSLPGPARQPTLKRGKGSARSVIPANKTNMLKAPSPYASDAVSEDLYSMGSGGELTRIRVKLHYNGSVRGMSISPDLPHSDFYSLICSKFNLNAVELQYKDEDAAMIEIVDEGDFESAIDAAREFSKGRSDSKLEVWVHEAREDI